MKDNWKLKFDLATAAIALIVIVLGTHFGTFSKETTDVQIAQSCPPVMLRGPYRFSEGKNDD